MATFLKVVLLGLSGAGVVLSQQQRGQSERGLGGDYCSVRPAGSQCCPDRVDECSRPIDGTLCYCDQFCERGVRGDCCPDYLSHCHGVTPRPEPIKTCYFGRYYNRGEKLKINCNECVCEDMNDHMEILCDKSRCLVDPDVLLRVNSLRRGWRASNYTQFWGRTLKEGQEKRLGTLISTKKVRSMRPLSKPPLGELARLPREFDSRSKWPGAIGPPADQDWCASSWAFSTVGVASDRWAIQSRGSVEERLSPEHLLSCYSRHRRGCRGEHLTRAWTFIRRFGLISEECYPWTGESAKCRVPKRIGALEAKCQRANVTEGWGGRKRAVLYRMGPAYRVAGEKAIMHEIIESGPVQATMMVFPDFFVYSSGVYRCPEDVPAASSGLHSVRIIGWGEEARAERRPVKYWVVANSWGEWWGEGGLFRILKGSNECRIEEFVLGAWTSSLSKSKSPRVDLGQDWGQNEVA